MLQYKWPVNLFIGHQENAKQNQNWISLYISVLAKKKKIDDVNVGENVE